MFLEGKVLRKASLSQGRNRNTNTVPNDFSSITSDLTVVNFCAMAVMTMISPVFLRTRFTQRSVKASPALDPALAEKNQYTARRLLCIYMSCVNLQCIVRAVNFYGALQGSEDEQLEKAELTEAKGNC